MGLGVTVGEAITVFLASNIDDLVLAAVFFAQIDRNRENSEGEKSARARNIHVVVGMVLGFTILVTISLAMLWIGLVFPAEYIALIGFVPLLNGLYKLYKLVRNKSKGEREDSELSQLDHVLEKIEMENNEQSKAAAGVMENNIQVDVNVKENNNVVDNNQKADEELIEIDLNNNSTDSTNAIDSVKTGIEKFMSLGSPKGINQNNQANESEVVEVGEQISVPNEKEPYPKAEVVPWRENPEKWSTKVFNKIRSWLTICMHPFSAECCLVVIADGGDSITTFIPIYLLQTSAELLLTISIFYALFAMMLVVAFYLLRFPPLARFLTKFGVWIRPFLLIGLGIFILTESVIFERADEAGETTSAAAGAGGIVDND